MSNSAAKTAEPGNSSCDRFLLLVVGLGGLLYGITLLVASVVDYSFESRRGDVVDKVKTLIVDGRLDFDLTITDLGKVAEDGQPVQQSIFYSYGKKQDVAVALSNDPKKRQFKVALLVNQGISTGTAAFLLLETKGRTLKEMEEHFEGGKSRS